MNLKLQVISEYLELFLMFLVFKVRNIKKRSSVSLENQLFSSKKSIV